MWEESKNYNDDYDDDVKNPDKSQQQHLARRMQREGTNKKWNTLVIILQKASLSRTNKNIESRYIQW